MKNTQIYTYTIPANGSVQILTEGTYLRILSSTGPVEVDADTYGNISLLAGQGVKGQPFKRLFLNDKSGGNNMVSLVISDGSFVDDRITGEVSVIDGGKSRTITEQAFTAYSAKAPNIAGDHAFIQLLNPEGSGKNVFIKSIIVSATIGQFIGISPANTAGLGALDRMSKPKKISGIDGITQVRSISQVAFLGSYNLTGGYVSGNGSLVIKLEEPILIEPGSGIAAGSSDTTTATVLTAAFELIEESSS